MVVISGLLVTKVLLESVEFAAILLGCTQFKGKSVDGEFSNCRASFQAGCWLAILVRSIVTFEEVTVAGEEVEMELRQTFHH